MAKLFEEVFREDSSGDIVLVIGDDPRDPEALQLRCHSLILTQHSYFYKMLSSAIPLREGVSREAYICEPQKEFVELLRFIYTNQVDVNRMTVAGLLILADKYCIDEVVDVCLKYIKENFDADIFFTFYSIATLNSAYQDKLKDQLKTALRQRRNLCAITEDVRWKQLPIGLVEDILGQDDLPISCEAEVLTLVSRWLDGNSCREEEVTRLLRSFRKGENVQVRVSDLAVVMKALGWDIFSDKAPRTGSSVWDPKFILHRHEGAGTMADPSDLEHQLGPKDYLQQEPGWAWPGVHRCRVKLTSTSWSHRERRLLRSGPGQAVALQKRAFECSPSKPGERSPSPPPSFQVRRPPVEAFETFEMAQMSDGSEQTLLGSGVIRNRSQTQDKIDHELVEHQVICGVSSGYGRHGIRISQCDKKAIYFVEDLNGKHSVRVGGTLTSVTFDLELAIGEASHCGISRCRFALLRNKHTLMEEWFDVSAKVPLRLYISSSYFDKSSTYTAAVQWLRTTAPAGRHFYIGK
mmetsp:Transcript_93399/g.166144  ORF Transcript_93399/g.166144 Transcript_93399/m.166144 type:complete len:521 (+) Transcript_93399:36-1598(+)